MTIARAFARKLTKRFEGLRLVPYRDTEGLLTIGYGHCLDRKGVSEAAAEFIFEEDYADTEERLSEMQSFQRLDPARQAVLLDMGFNLGYSGLMKFVKMWNALGREDYERAAAEMINSQWYHQVGIRSADLVDMMRTGEWPDYVNHTE